MQVSKPETPPRHAGTRAASCNTATAPDAGPRQPASGSGWCSRASPEAGCIADDANPGAEVASPPLHGHQHQSRSASSSSSTSAMISMTAGASGPTGTFASIHS